MHRCFLLWCGILQCGAWLVLLCGWYSSQLVDGANACPRTALVYPIPAIYWFLEDDLRYVASYSCLR